LSRHKNEPTETVSHPVAFGQSGPVGRVLADLNNRIEFIQREGVKVASDF